MSKTLSVLVIVVLIAACSGCAGTDRQRECSGPSTPINAAKQDRPNG